MDEEHVELQRLTSFLLHSTSVPIADRIFAVKTQSKYFLTVHEQVSLLVYSFIVLSFVSVRTKASINHEYFYAVYFQYIFMAD